MASVARLPSVQNVGGHVTQKVLSQIPSPPKYGAPTIKKSSKNKITTQKDRKDEKSKIDTQRYRNTYMHNLCLDMLKDGFHLSYCELFNLLKRERERREMLNADSGLPNLPFVDEQPEQLEHLKENLTTAEAGARRGKMDIVYGCYLTLATYFEELQEALLSNHFYKLCLDTSVKVRGDGRRKEAEANFNMGTAYEKQGAFLEALECFENFYNLTTGRLWQAEATGKKLFSTACECLQRIYTTVAQQFEETNPQERIGYLLKAYKVSKEGDDVPGQGEASYILGCAYQDYDDPETALMYHNEYLNICQQVDDVTGMGRACQALAKSSIKQMDVESAVKHLESFVELSEKSGNFTEQQTACTSIGEMLNSLGKYEDSAAYFEKAYKLSHKIEKNNAKELVCSEYGIVNGNLVLHGLSQAMNATDVSSISKLLNWKQSRKDVFSSDQDTPNNCSEDS